MKLDKNLEPFRSAIEALNRLILKYENRGAVIGGVAVSLLGKPRYTADVDAVFLLYSENLPQKRRRLRPQESRSVIKTRAIQDLG